MPPKFTFVFLQLTNPRIPTDVAGLNFGARGRGKRAWRRRSWTYTDALSKARMESMIRLCNVSRAQLQPQLAKHPMKLRHQLVRAALATLTVCRVTPDAMHNICSRTCSPTRGWLPHLMLKVPSMLTGCSVFPCIFVQMGHQLVPGGVVVGPDGGRATLGNPRWSRSWWTLHHPYRELTPYMDVSSNDQSVLSCFIIDDGSFCV